MTSFRPVLVRVVTIAVAVVAALGGFVSSGWAATNSSAAAAVEANIIPFIGKQLSDYATFDGPFEDGVWGMSTAYSPNGLCWGCDNGGPATAAATLYVLTGAEDRALLEEARETIDTAIAIRQTSNGAFTPPPADGSSPGIETMFFGVEFGTTYQLLASHVGAATRRRWQASLTAAANYLIHSGDVSWYANGNINLGYTEFLYLVWQATGERRFETAYNNSWSFIMAPPQSRFPGSGWRTVKGPTLSDGYDGAGYFTEAGPERNGYDPEYTTLQLTVAARLYLMSGDSRALRVTNMLQNMVAARINTATWMFNTGDGTRHTEPDRYVGYMSPAFAVLGLDAGRADLVSDILPQIRQEELWYSEGYQADSGVFRRAFGDDVAAIALAAATADPQLGSDLMGVRLLGRAPASVGRRKGTKAVQRRFILQSQRSVRQPQRSAMSYGRISRCLRAQRHRDTRLAVDPPAA